MCDIFWYVITCHRASSSSWWGEMIAVMLTFGLALADAASLQ
jgi:hypothetical protein